MKAQMVVTLIISILVAALAGIIFTTTARTTTQITSLSGFSNINFFLNTLTQACEEGYSSSSAYHEDGNLHIMQINIGSGEEIDVIGFKRASDERLIKEIPEFENCINQNCLCTFRANNCAKLGGETINCQYGRDETRLAKCIEPKRECTKTDVFLKEDNENELYDKIRNDYQIEPFNDNCDEDPFCFPVRVRGSTKKPGYFIPEQNKIKFTTCDDIGQDCCFSTETNLLRQIYGDEFEQQQFPELANLVFGANKKNSISTISSDNMITYSGYSFDMPQEERTQLIQQGTKEILYNQPCLNNFEIISCKPIDCTFTSSGGTPVLFFPIHPVDYDNMEVIKETYGIIKENGKSCVNGKECGSGHCIEGACRESCNGYEDKPCSIGKVSYIAASAGICIEGECYYGINPRDDNSKDYDVRILRYTTKSFRGERQ